MGLTHRFNYGTLPSRVNLRLAAFAFTCGILVAAVVAPTFAIETSASEQDKREKLHSIRQKQIPLMEALLAKNPVDTQRADILFRLSEAYFETGKYLQGKQQTASANQFFQKSLNALEDLRSNHRSYGRYDEVLFLLANNYIEKQDTQKAGPILNEIAQTYPNSPLLKEAAMLLGDYYFDQGKPLQAKPHYERALQDPKLKSYMHYKLAWVDLSTSNEASALKHYEEIVRLHNEKAVPESMDYIEEALKEMVWPALDVYGVKGVVAYLEQRNSNTEDLKKTLEVLASGLEQKHQYERAAIMYEQLHTRFPHDPHAEDWVAKQLAVEEKSGNMTKITSLLAKLNGLQSSSPDALKNQLSNWAKKYHALAKTDGDAKKKSQDYQLASTYYQAALNLETNEAKKQEAYFYLGDVYFDQGRYREAARAYQASAEGSHSMTAKAAWNYYLSTEKLATGFHYTSKEPKALSEGDEAFIAAARALQSAKGISMDQKRMASYQSARLMYQLNNYEMALPVFKFLAEKFPSTAEGKKSRELVLDIYNINKDYKNIAAYASVYQQSASKEDRQELAKLGEKAAIKMLQEKEVAAKASGSDKAQALKSVAGEWMAFAEQYSSSDFAPSAMFAALQLYANAMAENPEKDFIELRQTFATLMKKYPRYSKRSDAISLMGTFLSLARPEDVSEFKSYRSHFIQQMRAQPAGKRGDFGRLVYAMSSESEQQSLEKEFSGYPLTENNQEIVALGKVYEIGKAKEKLEAISMNSLKTLKANTQKKVAALEALQAKVTQVVDLKVSKAAMKSLKILGEAYKHVAMAFRTAPYPKSLKGEDLQKYQSAVGQKADVLEKKGEDAINLANSLKEKMGSAT